MLLVLAGLVACGKPPPKEPKVNNSYNYGSRYMWEMNGYQNDQLLRYLERRFVKDGGQVISVGQDYKLIFPNNMIFYNNSPRIYWNAYRVLNDVSRYLRVFNKSEVKVVVYVQSTGNPDRDHALSSMRSVNISDYLWGQNIGTGLMYAKGYVTTSQFNQIEISFRNVMV